MRIVLLNQWHSEKMGYSDNFLPKALASLGHEVHLVTSNGQVYFNSPAYKEIFEPFLGPGLVAPGVKKVDGYTLYRLPHIKWKGRVHIKGLLRKLFSLRPDVVQVGELFSLLTYEAALFKLFLGYKLFIECHTHVSVFPSAYKKGDEQSLYWCSFRTTIGRLVALLSEKCYPISSDAADIAHRFFGFPQHKINIRPLGVATDLFKPVSGKASQQARQKLRKQLGFSPHDIVCIYTGNFSRKAKNPLWLARAVGKLIRQGEPFRGLFVGGGRQKDVRAIRACRGCVVHPFVPVQKLPQFYQAADIGVWPKQESTSQLDAAACGLPIILSNRVKVRERVEGNGLLYKEGDVADLTYKIKALADPKKRQQLGQYGAKKMRRYFSWKHIAKQYIKDYQASRQH